MQKTKNVLFSVFKLAIGIGSVAYIIHHITTHRDIDTIKDVFTKEWNDSLPELIIAVSLVAVNWGLEALKWKKIIAPLESISFTHSFQSILTGVTASIFTPNRFGEFTGRIFFLEKANKIQATLLQFLGGFSQLTITFTTGLLALAFYSPHITSSIAKTVQFIPTVLVITTPLVIIILLFIYFNAGFLQSYLQKISILKKFQEHFSAFTLLSKKQLLNILLLSAVRYAVFSFQFYLLLRVLNVDIEFTTALPLIALTFFFITTIPSYALSEIGVRGSVALFLFSPYADNPIGIVAASFFLWLINVALPALAGVFFLYRWKWAKNG